MIPLLAALLNFTVLPETVDINDPVTATLTLAIDQTEPLDINILRGKLLSSGRFMLLNEQMERSANETKITWQIEPLESGQFPLSLYQIERANTPIRFVTVKPFVAPETLPPLALLPLEPKIPPTLSAANLALLDQWAALQPKLNYDEVQAKTLPWIPLLSALFLTLAAPFGLIFYERRARPAPPAPSPEEVAWAALQQIEAQSYVNPDAFIVDLTQTLRVFIQQKYGLMAPYLTTEEFLKTASVCPKMQGMAEDRLGLFLKAADLVKFAGREPSPSEYASALAFAKNYIGTRKR